MRKPDQTPITKEDQIEINYKNGLKMDNVFDWLENLDWGILSECDNVAKKKANEKQRKQKLIDQARLLLLKEDILQLSPIRYYGYEQYDENYEDLDDDDKKELVLYKWADNEEYLRFGSNPFDALSQLTCWIAPWELFVTKNYTPEESLSIIEKILTHTELSFSFRVDVSQYYKAKEKPTKPKTFLQWVKSYSDKPTIVGDLANETYITDLDFTELKDLREYCRKTMDQTMYNCFVIVWNIYNREYLRRLTPFHDKLDLSKIYYYLSNARYKNWENWMDDPDYKTCHNGYVYIFKAENGLYKIGKSKNPEQRIQSFRSSPVKVTILHLLESNNPFFHENMLHKHFKLKRKHSEWFALTDEDIALLTRFVNAKQLEFLQGK